jgi:2-dehydropantoate 2-reductase
MTQPAAPRLAIYGAGSLGTIIGAFIAKSGTQVDLINRNVAHIQALREHGAHVTGTLDFVQPVTALTPDEMTGAYDIIFLLTKQQFNRDVAEFLRPFMNDDSVLVTFQNGIPEPLLAQVLGERRVLGAVVEWGAELTGPGTVLLTSPLDVSFFRIGSLGIPNPEKLEQAARLLRLMCGVTIEENFIGVRWSKLLINAAFGGMSVALGQTFGQAVDDLRSRECVHMVMKECIDVAAAAGVTIVPVQGTDIVAIYNFTNRIKKWIANKLLPLAIGKHRNTRASLLQDLERGKKTEVDSINGVVCEWGERHGVATPYCRKIVEIVHRIEAGEGQPTVENLALFDELKQS